MALDRQQFRLRQYYYDDYQAQPLAPHDRISEVSLEAQPVSGDWWSEMNKLIFTLETTRSQFFTTLTIQVFANRVTLTYKPFIGAGETVQKYNAADIGNVFASKTRRWASVGVCMKNSPSPLFEIKRLKHKEAKKLKYALEKMIAFNQLVTFRRW